MKSLHLVNIATADFRGITLYEIPDMSGHIKFFCGTQYQIDARNISNFFGFQLGITTCYHHKTFRRFPLYLPDQITTFLVSIFSDGTGIDNINISQGIKGSLLKTLFLHQSGNGGGFRKIELTAQGMKCNCFRTCHGAQR